MMTKKKVSPIEKLSELRDETIYALQNIRDLKSVIHKHELGNYLNVVCDKQYLGYFWTKIAECADVLEELEAKIDQDIADYYEEGKIEIDGIPD